jgi:hypothetical protein
VRCVDRPPAILHGLAPRTLSSTSCNGVTAGHQLS